MRLLNLSKGPLDGSIKKNSAFVKKCKSITSENVDALTKEFSGLKADKYLEEIIISLSENKFNKATDAIAAARVCVELHLRFEDFDQSILKALWGIFLFL